MISLLGTNQSIRVEKSRFKRFHYILHSGKFDTQRGTIVEKYSFCSVEYQKNFRLQVLKIAMYYLQISYILILFI